jgi:peptidoglycan/LPS O-acetylase OafA/YrhL
MPDEARTPCFPHITLQKTLCLLGVLFLHATLPFTEGSPFWKLYADERSVAATALASFLGAVLIPSFIFASGFLLAHALKQRQRTFSERLASRVRRLLRPWLLTVLFWLVPLYTLFDLPSFNRPLHATLLEGYSAALRGLFADHLWFLLVLFWVTLFWLLLLPLVCRTNQFVGFVVAVAAAALAQGFGGGLTWFCFWEISAPLFFFYLGCLAYWHRERIDSLLMRFPLLLLFGLAAALAVLSPLPSAPFVVACLVSGVGCAFSYLLSLMLVRKGYQSLCAFVPYRYFEEHSFRFYLFHMPPGLLVFKIVNGAVELPVFLQIVVIFVLCFTATSVIVIVSCRLEEMVRARRIYTRLRSGSRRP